MSRMLAALKQLDHCAPGTAVEPGELAAAPKSSVSQGAGTTYEMSLHQGPATPRLARQFRRLADHLIGQWPTDKGGAVLLTGSGDGSHVADVAGQLCRELAQRCRRDSLLVDADGTRRILSQRFAATEEPALAEILLEARSVRGSVVGSVVPHLKFLPFGNTPVSRRVLSWPAVESLLMSLKRNYRYVIVAGDAAHNPLTEAMARFCDGTYFVVPLGRAEKEASVDSARNLVAAGARMLGCIVTGAT